MLNLHMYAFYESSIFRSTSLFFSSDLSFTSDYQSHCWLILYPEQSSEDNFRVKKSVEDLRHENVGLSGISSYNITTRSNI